MTMKMGFAGLMLGALSMQAQAMKNPLSVHVLNQQTGLPSQQMGVTLEKKVGDKWVRLAARQTDAQGRIGGLYPEAEKFTQGDYRITFETGEYFSRDNQATFYPQVPVIIRVENVNEHYHVPLLISQYGFSTYRGS
ncbi:hydroxyisourate hydrolase [Serratia marcescens]|uniref:hydroxyisourate hydrolase n=1 Tax=Serratia marcescens TaxID=615 RepID=UPI000CDD74B2|nr:hydroxyisourate hydrolase [Serratia marcescens]MDP8745022.1 hydroxyisourate hydrolase [Serratia marcescens]POX29641.1 hydroxyisourate hydrolase [Serratia marcescens]RTF43329.1 hydroxyisourate hydrolase [Serratia marcescens]HEJ7838899.1 hydroxyisourate hydrolase [Serratia marcescens]